MGEPCEPPPKVRRLGTPEGSVESRDRTHEEGQSAGCGSEDEFLFESQGSSPRGGSVIALADLLGDDASNITTTEPEPEADDDLESWELVSSASSATSEPPTSVGRHRRLYEPSGSSGPHPPYNPIGLILDGIYADLFPSANLDDSEPMLNLQQHSHGSVGVGSSFSDCVTVVPEDLETGASLSECSWERDPSDTNEEITESDRQQNVLILSTAGSSERPSRAAWSSQAWKNFGDLISFIRLRKMCATSNPFLDSLIGQRACTLPYRVMVENRVVIPWAEKVYCSRVSVPIK